MSQPITPIVKVVRDNSQHVDMLFLPQCIVPDEGGNNDEERAIKHMENHEAVAITDRFLHNIRKPVCIVLPHGSFMGLRFFFAFDKQPRPHALSRAADSILLTQTVLAALNDQPTGTSAFTLDALIMLRRWARLEEPHSRETWFPQVYKSTSRVRHQI